MEDVHSRRAIVGNKQPIAQDALLDDIIHGDDDALRVDVDFEREGAGCEGTNQSLGLRTAMGNKEREHTSDTAPSPPRRRPRSRRRTSSSARPSVQQLGRH